MLLDDDPKLKTIAGRASKRLGLASELGEIIIAESHYGDCNEYNGIYQQRKTKLGKRTIREKHYYPANPKTDPQKTWREVLAGAVADWQALTEEQKNAYRDLSKYAPMTGFNLYIRTRLLSTP